MQFANPNQRNLKDLMIDAGIWDEEYKHLIVKLYDNCEICKRFHKTPATPVVCLPLASDFNDVVAMDLKLWKNGYYILYLIDMFSRFTKAEFIEDKLPSTIIDKLMFLWIGCGFLADSGKGFANEEYQDMCENLNIEVMKTAAESPLQNGLCERNHCVTDRCLQKILEDNPEVPLNIALP